jgi:hypothetical protein
MLAGNKSVGSVQGCLGTEECGARFSVRLREELEEGTLSYRFKFGAEYGGTARPGTSKHGDVFGLIDNWTLGGKMPGLADEEDATACGRSADVTGTGSFVARTMFRQGGAVSMHIVPCKFPDFIAYMPPLAVIVLALCANKQGIACCDCVALDCFCTPAPHAAV